MGRRLFLAVNPEPVLLASLEALLARLSPLHGVRWVGADSVHVTMVFLGETTEEQLEALADGCRDALKGTAPFVMEITGLGVFPDLRRPRIVWCGVGEGAEELARVNDRLWTAVAGCGFEREERHFRPHLTLGRIRDRLEGTARTQLESALGTGARIGRSRVTEVSLMESHPGSGPARYEVLERFPLGGQG